MSTWCERKFGDVATLSNGANFTKGEFGSGLKILGVKDFKDRTVPDWSAMDEVNRAALNSKRQLLAEGDLVFVRSNGNPSLVGRSMLITAGPLATHSAFTIKARPSRELVLPRFLAYQMRNAHRIGLMRAANGTNITNLSQPILANVPVLIPDLQTQSKVLDVLGAIDDLIENSRRRVEVLEEMARAIYREWFVKFRYPGHEDVPMVDSEIGPIPEGWIARPFSEVVDFHIGGGWGTAQEDLGSEQPGYVIRGTDIPRVTKSDVSTVPFRFHRESNIRSRKLEHGDIVFEASGGSKGQPVGRTLLIQQPILDLFDAPVMCASFCKIIRAKSTVVEPSILIRLLQDAYSTGQLDAYQVQSTGITNFKWKPFLEHFKVVLPPKRQQEKMVRIFAQLDELGDNVGRRIQVLSQIRDMLLPKLVTGEIDVSTLDLDALVAAERVSEDAVA